MRETQPEKHNRKLILYGCYNSRLLLILLYWLDAVFVSQQH